MKKGSFYICVLKRDGSFNRAIEAEKMPGWVDGDIGIHEVKYNNLISSWVATHIPTGLRLVNERQECHKTRAAALKSAKEKIADPGFHGRVMEISKGEAFQQFQRSRHEKEIT